MVIALEVAALVFVALAPAEPFIELISASDDSLPGANASTSVGLCTERTGSAGENTSATLSGGGDAEDVEFVNVEFDITDAVVFVLSLIEEVLFARGWGWTSACCTESGPEVSQRGLMIPLPEL